MSSVSSGAPNRRVALVTGAGLGLGLGISEAFAEAGFSVAVNDLQAERAEKTVADIKAKGGKAVAAPFNVTDFEAAKRAIERAERELGAIDILVNNAGSGVDTGGSIGRFKDSDPASWRRQVDLNFYGSLHMIRIVLPGMVERGWGRVVQITSGVAARGIPAGVSVYGGAKAGIEGALRNIAIEEAKSGVTLNAVSPGLLSNNAGRAAIVGGQDATPGTLANIPMGRLSEPREVAGCILWLVSDLAGYVTGQTIHINGGTIHGR